MVDGKVIRRTFPTASHSYKDYHLVWIEEQAKKRDISKSELMRKLVDDAIAAQEKQAA
jgi:hypothetical protein